MCELTDGWMNGWIIGWVDIWADQFVYESTLSDRQKNTIGEWMNIKMNKWMDSRVYIHRWMSTL